MLINAWGHYTPDEVLRLLNVRRLPSILYTDQAALLLGIHDHDIPILVDANLLVPLGNPKPNAPKRFAAVTITKLGNDPAWLDKAIRILTKHWRDKNHRRKPRPND